MNDFDQRFADKIPWVQFANVGGQTIPPFSVIQAGKWYFPDPSLALGTNFLSPYFDGALAGYFSSSSTPPSARVNPHELYITGDLDTPPATGPGPNGVAARPIEYPQLLTVQNGQLQHGDTFGRMLGAGVRPFQATRDLPGFVMMAPPQGGLALVMMSKGPYRAILGSGTNQGEITVTPIQEPWQDVGPPPLASISQPIYNPFGAINVSGGAPNRCTYDWVGFGNWELIAANPCPPPSSGGIGGT